ncbi:MAG: hypothetical protein JWO05_1027 [Gemmatimonadetes bacterium]|nr:hypothetical protein [Gemmatimonadota bacterium]
MSAVIKPVKIALALIVWGYGLYCILKAGQFRTGHPRSRVSQRIVWSELTPLGRQWALRAISAWVTFALLIFALTACGRVDRSTRSDSTITNGGSADSIAWLPFSFGPVRGQRPSGGVIDSLPTDYRGTKTLVIRAFDALPEGKYSAALSLWTKRRGESLAHLIARVSEDDVDDPCTVDGSPPPLALPRVRWIGHRSRCPGSLTVDYWIDLDTLALGIAYEVDSAAGPSSMSRKVPAHIISSLRVRDSR